MKLKSFGIATAIGAILLGAASCINVNEGLGSNFIPTEQIWNVYPCEPEVLENITMDLSDSLSGYSSSRITFGSVKEGEFLSNNSSSFTLVPLNDTLDFGDDTEILQFHLTAVRDTVSVINKAQLRMLQNFYVHPLKKPLDSTILYTGTFYDKKNIEDYIDMNRIITEGIPVYNGGDSLSFDFSREYAAELISGIKKWQEKYKEERTDSLSYYLKEVPGIYIRTEEQTEDGGRINMFELPISTSDGYIDGNYAELKIRAKYDGRQTDTLFVFIFGPAEFMTSEDTQYPSQLALNASTNLEKADFIENWNNGDKTKLYVEGGSGYKPVVKASEIRELAYKMITKEAPEDDIDNIVINKATIILPYDQSNYDLLDRYPMVLSPTVRLKSSDGKYVTYAGLTDSSIESENHGEINRSLSMYSPDVSHHVQEIVKLKRGVGEDVDPNETEAQFAKRLEKYDIWFLILYEEVVESSSSSSSYNDYYNNLLYNSYYNNMMYDPYGYGYGYGGYGYGYGGYGYSGYGGYGGYGYNNYYNYLLMAQYASAANSSSTQTSTNTELDKDRFYNAALNGPGAGGNDIEQKPRLKITFSTPKKAEE